MIRALYVDINLVHLNPSATHFPLLVEAAIPYTDFFGPGFTTPEILGKGLLNWVRENGPYQVLVIGPNSPVYAADMDNAISGTLKYLRRSTVHTHSVLQVVEFVKDLFKVLPRLNIEHRLASSMNFDYYAATKAQLQCVHDWNLSLIGPNEQFVRPLAELPAYVRQEKHFRRKESRVSDCWFDFLHSHPERVITAVHYVLPSEFCFTPIHLRRPIIAVPGAEYYLRKNAIADLRRSSIRTASKWYFHMFRVLNKVGVPVYGNSLGLHLYNQLFQRTLRTSRYVYTARGGFGLPVRKFFEIPAAGALMLCSPCTGYLELGFVDGVHYHAVEPDELSSFLHKLTKTGSGHDVAIAGRTLSAINHSLQARATQVAACIQALTNGNYRGARWNGGEFVLIGEKPSVG